MVRGVREVLHRVLVVQVVRVVLADRRRGDPMGGLHRMAATRAAGMVHPSLHLADRIRLRLADPRIHRRLCRLLVRNRHRPMGPVPAEGRWGAMRPRAGSLEGHPQCCPSRLKVVGTPEPALVLVRQRLWVLVVADPPVGVHRGHFRGLLAVWLVVASVPVCVPWRCGEASMGRP